LSEVSTSALVVVAHPDDCEFACGGTVGKWVKAGAKVTLVVVTDGRLGSHDTSVSDSDLIRTRENEQLEAGRILGLSEIRFYGVHDGSARSDEELVERLVYEIRRTRPQRLVTHDPWKRYMLHPDHLEVGRAVVVAAVRAREPRVKRELPEWRPDDLWLFRAQEPNHTEDTSEGYEQQVKALLCHRSQYPTSMGFEDGDEEGRLRFLKGFEQAATGAGEPAGYSRGEIFRRLRL
jgi:LmbE family N-acetylglucosaminyl deacetylase